MKIFALFLLSLVLTACSSGSKDCTPGERRTCTCPDMSQSLQDCNESGKWGECACSDTDGGSDAGNNGDDGGQVTDEGSQDGGDEADDAGQTTDDQPETYTIASLRSEPPTDGTPVGLEGVIVTSQIFADYDHEDYDNPMKSFFVSAPDLATTEANSGMQVALATGTVAPVLVPGDIVNLAGQFYSSDDPPAFGMSFVRIGDGDPIEKTGTGNPPTPAIVTVAEAASEEWEAVQVALNTGTVTATQTTFNTVTIDDLLEIDDHIIRSLNGGVTIPFEACVDQTVESATGFNYYSYSARRLLPPDILDVSLAGICEEEVDCGSAPPANHLLLSEVSVGPTEFEFVEIHNPTGSAIDLSNYFLWNATYRNVDSGCCTTPGGSAKFHWMVCEAAGRAAIEAGWSDTNQDFIIGFPAGASIGPQEYQTVAMAGKQAFCDTFEVAPDYEFAVPAGGECQIGAQVVIVPAMEEGPLGFPTRCDAPRLSNGGEEVVLFNWSGTDGDPVKDVDTVLWGDKCEAYDRNGSETCNGTSYQADTTCGLQDIVRDTQHPTGSSWQRACLNEGTESTTGGNGLTGNDETSENLSQTWTENESTPGSARP